MGVDKKAFRSLSYGLYLITAKSDGSANDGAAGCVANTFAQVTSSPFQVSVALNKENVTASVVQESGRFACTVLAQSATMELIGAFGFRTSSEFDKFADFQVAHDAAGVPYVAEQAVARFSVRVTKCVDVGTHVLFIGEVEEAEKLADEEPMTYAYYHQVKGGKTPPKASSYTGADDSEPANKSTKGGESTDESASDADAPAGETEGQDSAAPAKRYGWRCMVCGYVVETDELPDDYECPICGAGKDMFERIKL
ncbi:flavin reductase [Adlercreutzia sp. ZJ138]|uniref:flavin reductase n=1 Tax=Adlercreutzia sp. ZJ138 TaxID=2709405 RepID=UPI0013EDA203|nr:flavin reductase [Adlercreutzia sp. ZJ138]